MSIHNEHCHTLNIHILCIVIYHSRSGIGINYSPFSKQWNQCHLRYVQWKENCKHLSAFATRYCPSKQKQICIPRHRLEDFCESEHATNCPKQQNDCLYFSDNWQGTGPRTNVRSVLNFPQANSQRLGGKYFLSYQTHTHTLLPEGVSLNLNIQRIFCYDKITV